MRRSWILFLPVAAVMFALAGCSRTPLLDQKVAAENSREFASWQTRARGEVATDQWTEFEAALSEIKLRIIALKEASGSEAVTSAMLPKIHGKTVREVLQQGYEAKKWRLNVEREELEKIIAGNATLRTKPGDVASAGYLERKQRDDTARLNRAKEEIRVADERLKALATPTK